MRLQKNKKPLKNKIIIAVAVVVTLLLVLFILEKTGVTNFIHTKKKATTASEFTKGETTTSSKSSGKTNTNNTGSSGTPTDNNTGIDDKTSSSANNTPSGAAPAAPSGDFVSDYAPNLGGSPHPNTLGSVCNTTPGATCTIVFTMGSTTKSLPQTTVDAGGAAYWTWRLQDVGLTTGSWNVKAVATMNGKTTTTASSIQLEVKP